VPCFSMVRRALLMECDRSISICGSEPAENEPQLEEPRLLPCRQSTAGRLSLPRIVHLKRKHLRRTSAERRWHGDPIRQVQRSTRQRHEPDLDRIAVL
jgi:hypothetical protein